MFQGIRRVLLFLLGISMPNLDFGSFDLLGTPVTLTKLATTLLLVFLAASWPARKRRFPSNRKHPAIAAFLFAVAVSTAISVGKGIPLVGLLPVLSTFLAVAIFAFLIPYSTENQRDLDVLLLALVVGAVIAVGGGFLLGLGTAEEGGRFKGTATGSPNLLAQSLAAILPVVFLLFFSTPLGFRKALLMGAAVVTTAGIVLSLSRGAFVSVAAMWALWVWRFRRFDTIRYVAPTIVFALGIMLLAPAAFYERIGTLRAGEREYDSSIRGRLASNYWGTHAFISNPMLGVGIRQAGSYIHEREPRIPPKHSIHNAYLQIAAEFGLLGLVPFGLILFFSWRDFSRSWQVGRRPPYKDDPEVRQLAQRAVFLQIGLVGVMITSLFSPAVTSKMFWMYIGLSSAVVELTRQRLGALEAGLGSEPVRPEVVGFEPRASAGLTLR